MTKTRRIGKYEILKRIGGGGSADVYRARDTESNRLVALKVLRSFLSNEPSFVQRFLTEAKTAAELNHTNIVPVYESGESDGELYLAMALFGEGRSLRNLLDEQEEPLSPKQVLPILEQLASALDYLHKRDQPLTHRDVKPANILLKGEGNGIEIALGDFGLVRSAEIDTRLTESGTLLGTAAYMAPEQADPKQWGDITPRTDVYALGVVAYEMLTGCVPFEDDNPMTVLHAHIYDEPPSIIEIKPDLGEDLAAVLKRALAKPSQQRYPSAGALVDALRQAMQDRTHREEQAVTLAHLLDQAQAARQNRDWVSVQDLCVQALRIDSMHSAAIQMMEEAVAELRRAAEEEAACRRRAERYQEGELAFAEGRWQDAFEAFDEVARDDPSFQDVQEKREQARREYRGTWASIVDQGQLGEILATAKQRVRLLGVVALDADWEYLAGKWAAQLASNPDFRVTVLCESDNLLFSRSFTYDTDIAQNRRSFADLKFVRDRALVDLADFLSQAERSENKNVEIEITYLPMPISVVQVDGRVFVNLWLHESEIYFEEIPGEHPWHSLTMKYVDTYLAPGLGRKYACDPDGEVLELFDHRRIPRGIYPRSSFYDTDYSQLVVWAFVFDRQGRLLIHRRSDNAKDNRGMWDKSVGGHINFLTDVDTSRAALREVIEELFSDELKRSKSDFTTWSVADRDMVFLGEWRPDPRGRHPFYEIRAFEREWAFFRLRDSQHLYSPRMLPDGKERRLRVIADVFLFVANSQLTDASLGELKNSVFKLVDISELKNVMDKAQHGEEVPGFDQNNPVPTFTPDLKNIMTSRLRDVLAEFSRHIERYIKDREGEK